jgi:hypothetical protein
VTTVRRWPLFLIASPAAVAIWSGWVGLGGLCGFGPIHPLPGIADGLVINTAITLPVGVEAYGAYALRAWLTPGVPERAQRFAKASALGALALGMCGQVIYHLLAAVHATRAPWPVTMLVSCVPVITLGFGAALTHLLRTADPEPVRDSGPVSVPDPDGKAGDRTEPPGDDARTDLPDQRAPLTREEIVALLAEEIRDAIEAGERWQPDYPALMVSTGRRRSWCEKAVREARMTVLDSPAGRAGDAASPRTDDGAPRARTEPAGAAGGPGTDDPDGVAGDRTGELALTGAP